MQYRYILLHSTIAVTGYEERKKPSEVTTVATGDEWTSSRGLSELPGRSRWAVQQPIGNERRLRRKRHAGRQSREDNGNSMRTMRVSSLCPFLAVAILASNFEGSERCSNRGNRGEQCRSEDGKHSAMSSSCFRGDGDYLDLRRSSGRSQEEHPPDRHGSRQAWPFYWGAPQSLSGSTALIGVTTKSCALIVMFYSQHAFAV